MKYAFDFGDYVFLTTDPDSMKRVVTSILLLPNGVVKYGCSFMDEMDYFYEFELEMCEF